MEDPHSDFSDSGSEYNPYQENTAEDSDSSSSHANDNIEEISLKTRKRLRNEAEWKTNKRKMLRNSGKIYNNKKGVAVRPKVFSNVECKCPKKCVNTFTESERRGLFNSFWELGDFSRQNIYLHGLVNSNPVVRKRPKDGSRPGVRQTSLKYFLKVENKTELVCKKYFLATFQISNGRLYRCVSKKSIEQCVDKRGTTSSRKFDDSDIVEHIQMFPAYQSHYTRKQNPHRKYLHPDLTIKKMYDLYRQSCESKLVEPKNLKYYYKVFNTKFNLHFKPPRQDTCKTCDELNLKLQAAENEEDKKSFQMQHDLHLRKAGAARDSLRTDSRKVDDAYIFTFDLQKALAFPKLTTSVAYYKRNLYVYNLGIHCFNDGRAYMYVWDETEGGRGSQDVASCLARHIKEHAPNKDHIIMYSDSCTGQNRNIKISLTLLKLVQDQANLISTIDHKFLVSGHSFLPNDADFGIIENASRHHSLIYSREQWISIIQNAKRKEPVFRVTEMNHSDFLSKQNLEKAITNRKKTECGYSFSWLNIRWFRYEKDHPLQLKFKENLNPDVEFRCVDLSKKSTKTQTLTKVEQNLLYPTRRQVTAIKKKDMLDLLPYIPPVHHPYYKNLPTETSTRASVAMQETENSSDDENIYD